MLFSKKIILVISVNEVTTNQKHYRIHIYFDKFTMINTPIYVCVLIMQLTFSNQREGFHNTLRFTYLYFTDNYKHGDTQLYIVIYYQNYFEIL